MYRRKISKRDAEGEEKKERRKKEEKREIYSSLSRALVPGLFTVFLRDCLPGATVAPFIRAFVTNSAAAAAVSFLATDELEKLGFFTASTRQPVGKNLGSVERRSS